MQEPGINPTIKIEVGENLPGQNEVLSPKERLAKKEALWEAYKEQNPAKYEAKKKQREAELGALREAAGVKEPKSEKKTEDKKAPELKSASKPKSKPRSRTNNRAKK